MKRLVTHTLLLAALAGVVSLVLTLLMPPATAQRGEEGDWIQALTNAVLIERRGGGGHPGVRWEPYVGQLIVVRTHFERGDAGATYKAMNQLMDMLENRENEVPAATADWLFDFCYLVTPAKYHDVSRHIHKFMKDQYGESVG